jgi:hypothetical protein
MLKYIHEIAARVWGLLQGNTRYGSRVAGSGQGVIASPLLVIRQTLANGGAAEVPIFADGAVPCNLQILETILHTTSVGAQNVALWSQTGGVGVVCPAITEIGAGGGTVRQSTVDGIHTLAGMTTGVGLFAVRSNNALVGELVLICAKN